MNKQIVRTIERTNEKINCTNNVGLKEQANRTNQGVEKWTNKLYNPNKAVASLEQVLGMLHPHTHTHF